MDIEGLVNDGIITDATRDWIEPHWRLDEHEAQEAHDAASQNIFIGDQDDDSLNGLVDDASITIYGKTILYRIEETSTGHGNRVWAASIAACCYIFDRFQAEEDVWSQASFQSIEFGAGTALPSLYLAHLLATRDYPSKPSVHITDAKQYRNIRQILASVVQQPMAIRQRINIRVSPHDWGMGIGTTDGDCSFLLHECCGPRTSNAYDLVVVSDCIYNSNFHTELLQSISRTLALPRDIETASGVTPRNYSQGGCAIVSFSLHGNIGDDAVWKFFDMANITRSPDGEWRLQAVPVSPLSSESSNSDRASDGWNMEERMKELGVWVAQLEPRRWIAYLYELRWVPEEDV